MSVEQAAEVAVQALRWRDERLEILDQTQLPAREHYQALESVEQVVEAIRSMQVRGAPAIGIAAAYGLVLAARNRLAGLSAAAESLRAARPTAVHLQWAVQRMLAVEVGAGQSLQDALLAEARRLHAEDAQANRRMGETGAALLNNPCRVLTHCNTGALATGGWGTALGVIRSAWSAGRLEQVWVGETRPWLQGARLTAWELQREKIPFQLIVDSAAAALMQRRLVDWVIVGADRIAANGDTANKIGTYSLAVAAQYHGVRLMVVAPTATIDSDLADGAAIKIEERGAEELTRCGDQVIAAPGTPAFNPVFDVTPAKMIDVLVTEKGYVRGPDRFKIRSHLRSP